MQPNPVDTFFQEADDLLSEIESVALSMVGAGSADEVINQIFRAFHTLKGSGAMFGFEDVARFTHHVESLLDLVRDGVVPASRELSNLILAAADHIGLLLAAARGGVSVPQGSEDALLQQVRELSAIPAGAASNDLEQATADAPHSSSKEPACNQLWRIVFRPNPSLLAVGGNPLLLFRDLKKLGECSIEGHFDAVPQLASLEPDVCYLWWTIDLTAAVSIDDIRDVFLFVEDGSELKIEPIAPPAVVNVAEVLQARPQAAVTPLAASASAKDSTVRVPSRKLDRLVNLVGELVMNRSRLASAVARYGVPELLAPVEEIERLVAELRDEVLQIRMMPIGSLFGRFRRLVHDLSAQLGKEVELVTEGAETELDKSILDQLGEPLVHLLRNSVDHGIETPAERLAKGKPRRGTIRLAATHLGSDVIVRIEDDGAGLNREKIRAKAVGKQIISSDAALSDKEILNLILLPGFSTADAVTSVSGRGVGMDVVKRQIDALRGSLALASEFGHGACVSLTLPLTLAIIEGLLVEIGENQFIIPMAEVTENVEISQTERIRNNGRNVTAVRGELIPYIDLRESFHIAGAPPPVSKIVLVRYEEQRIGLVVDRVMGTHQTVIQALGKFFKGIHVISGSTVMGDGRVALILDVAGLVRLADGPGTRSTVRSIDLPRAAA